VNQIALFAGLVAAGYVTRVILELVAKNAGVYSVLVKVLTNAVYYALIPLSFFATFLKRGLLSVDAVIAAYFVAFMLSAYAASTRLFSGVERYSILLLSAFPNSVFLGFPVCQVLFGNVKIAALFGTVTVALNVIVPDLIKAGRPSLGLAKSLATSTALLGFAAGTLAHYALEPSVAAGVHEYLAWSTPALSYTATFVMGMRIPVKPSGFRRHARLVGFVALARFAAAPLASLAFSLPAGFSREDALQLLVVSMMPPAVMNTLVAQKHNWNPELVALATAVLTVAFLLAFPILYLAVALS